jgi:hypothetical protein
MMDLEWAVIRMCPRKLLSMDIARLNPIDQKVPGWSGFHVLVTATTPQCTEVGYCPLINGSPTEYSTVYTVLKTAQKMMDSL